MKPSYPCVLQKGPSDNAAAALLTVARRLGIPIASAYVRKEMRTHAAPTSARAIVEMAARIGIKAAGVRGDWSGLRQATMPVIAHFNGADGPVFVAVHAIDDAGVDVADPDVGCVRMSPAEFQSRATGIFILAERIPDFVFRRPSGYAALRLRSLVEEHTKPILVGCGVTALILLSTQASVAAGPAFAVLCSLNFLGLAIGFVLSEFVLGGAGKSIVGAFCPVSPKPGCMAALLGPRGKVGGRVPYAVLGLGFYFAMQILLIVSGRAGLSVVAIGYSAAVGLAVYLTYQQARALKSWCVWCMALHGLNLVAATLAWVLTSQTTFDLVWALPAFLLLGGVVIAYDHRSASARLVATRRELGRLRADPIVLAALHRSHPRADVGRRDDWTCRSPGAAVRITVVSNPLCEHCGPMHQMLRRMSSQGSPIRWGVRFLNGLLPERCPELLTSGKRGDPTELSLLLLTIGVSLGSEPFWKALDAVYAAQPEFARMTSVEAMRVLGVSPEELAAGWDDGFRLLQLDAEICGRNRVVSTPRVFLDERPLPEWATLNQVAGLIQAAATRNFSNSTDKVTVGA